MVIRLCSGVPALGLQRAIRSGLGRPTEFLTTSVRNVVNMMLIARPSIVTFVLCRPGLRMMAHSKNTHNGRKTE